MEPHDDGRNRCPWQDAGHLRTWIGLAVARRAWGFGMNVLYNDAFRDEKAEKENGLKFASFDNMLAAADFLTIHVPMTLETRHRIGRREIGLMKRGAFLINTSRGPVVDEKALYTALARRKIAGRPLMSTRTSQSVRPALWRA